MDEKTPEYQPGRAPVWADQVAAHGAPPNRPLVDRMTYASLGPPPWAGGRKKTAPWTVMVTVLGSVALCVLGCLGLALVGGGDPDGPAPAPSSPSPAAVTTSGGRLRWSRRPERAPVVKETGKGSGKSSGGRRSWFR